MEGDCNPADWATNRITELGERSFWQTGPSFLMEHVSKWPVKLDFRTDCLDGEIQAMNVNVVLLSSEVLSMVKELLQNSSSIRKLFNTVAYMFKWTSLMRKTEEREATGIITVEEVNQARTF